MVLPPRGVESPSIVTASVADAPTIVPVLARAFESDIALRWMLREDDGRARALHDWFVANTQLSLHHGVSTTAHVAGRVVGVALWVPPNKWKLGPLEQLPYIPAMVRAFGLRKLLRSQRSLAFVQKHHLHAPHFYLLALGVEPLVQGRGVGKALLQPMLERCDAERMDAYLETNSEQNVRLYRSRGFEVFHEEAMPSGGPMTSFMHRRPR
jgi:ribosomal protein S18 acetylase RimI-like enzyme